MTFSIIRHDLITGDIETLDTTDSFERAMDFKAEYEEEDMDIANAEYWVQEEDEEENRDNSDYIDSCFWNLHIELLNVGMCEADFIPRKW